MNTLYMVVPKGALKMQDKTLQDRTMTDKLAGPDFAGQAMTDKRSTMPE